MLASTLRSLNRSAVPIGYVQLDDWWYTGKVYEGAVTCVSNWSARPDWFPRGLAELGVPLMLYVPYFCGDNVYAASGAPFVSDGNERSGGVPDAADGAHCPWVSAVGSEPYDYVGAWAAILEHGRRY